MDTSRIKVKRMPLGETTDQGPFYCQVDGENVGADGRSHWETESDAMACGRRYLIAMENS